MKEHFGIPIHSLKSGDIYRESQIWEEDRFEYIFIGFLPKFKVRGKYREGLELLASHSSPLNCASSVSAIMVLLFSNDLIRLFAEVRPMPKLDDSIIELYKG